MAVLGSWVVLGWFSSNLWRCECLQSYSLFKAPLKVFETYSCLFLLIFVFSLSSSVFSSPSVFAQENIRPTRANVHQKQVINRNKLTVSVITGEVASTHLRMASDMANALDGKDGNSLRIIPVVGKGGVQNFLDILFLKGIDMGIVQQGQLKYLQVQDPKLYADVKSRMQFISKLYNAEFHLIVPRRITSMKMLQGKKVSFGQKLGSSDVIARTIFDKLNVDVDRVHEDLSAGLNKLKSGELSGVAVVGGAPIQGINDIALGDDFHFLPIDPKTVGLKPYFNLIDDFLPTKITSDQYPGMIEKDGFVSSIASGALLVVYKWAPKSKRYKKLDVFVQGFFNGFDEFLRPSRHPKWREVSLHANVPGWTRFQPAADWLSKRRQEIGQEVSAGEMKIAMDVFVRQYMKVGTSDEVTILQRDDIWAGMRRVFGRWWTG